MAHLENHRLPSFAVPAHYDILLVPDLVACIFTGHVSIHLDILHPTRSLLLNSLDLHVDPTSVCFSSLAAAEAAMELFPEEEILVLSFARDLPLGRGVLEIGFSGMLNDHMRGFYTSKFEVDGVMKNMAVTQFEAVEARRCFPCWDEPALKATFKITVQVPTDYIALSNMPSIEQVVDGIKKTVHFEVTPIMSTYLVAVVVGLFDCIQESTDDGIKVSVYCPIGKSDQGKFGLHIALKSLELYKKYFSYPYSLPKLDLVVIPDFSGGAMENYGLITFRDTALLYDEHYSTAANKQWIATVVAHEVAHQWFGNLVTMEWWTHLWLNEGFATWVSYLGTDEFFPEWKIWTQFLEQTVGGLKMDALAESHPIEVEIPQARAIDEIFDAISYKKGSSVIRMLQAYLGYDIFQKSLAAYIKRYAYQNAKTEDLWHVLSEESLIPVKTIMETWTKQQGYPVINIKCTDNMLEFEQSQFLSSGSSGDAQWVVPITISLGSYSVQTSFLLDSQTKTLDISEFLIQPEKNSEELWVKVNVEQTGFYRVQYEDILFSRLKEAIRGKCLSATDRFGVLDDTYALCEAGKVPLSSLLSLMNTYKMELEYIVLSRLISIILRVSKVAGCALQNVKGLEIFFISLLESSLERLGWDHMEGESHHSGLLRGEVLGALGLLGHEVTRKEATRRFTAFLEDNNSPLLPPDIRKATYTTVMRSVTTVNRSGLDSLLEVYRKTAIGQEKGRILGALTSSPDPNIVLEALNFLLSSELRDQDVIYGLAGISWEGGETAWSWLKYNWDVISERWGHHFLLTHFISGIITLSSTNERADEMEAFFIDRTKPSFARNLRQSIEQVRVNAKLVNNIKSEHGLEELIAELV